VKRVSYDLWLYLRTNSFPLFVTSIEKSSAFQAMPGNSKFTRKPRNGKNKRRPRPTGKTLTQFSQVAGTGKNASKGVLSTLDDARLVARSKPLFPWRTRRTLTYYDSSSIITGTSTNNAYVFAANGLYDPDITSTGHQPMGFDQMMAFYNHYTVLSTKIRVIASNSSNALITMFGVSLSGTSTVTSSVQQLVEAGGLVSRLLGYVGQEGSKSTFVASVNIAAFQGVDDPLDDPNLRGDVASNPAELVYFHLNTWNPTSATQVTSTFQVYLDFDVVFQEPRIPTLSSEKKIEPPPRGPSWTSEAPQVCSESGDKYDSAVEPPLVRGEWKSEMEEFRSALEAARRPFEALAIRIPHPISESPVIIPSFTLKSITSAKAVP